MVVAYLSLEKCKRNQRGLTSNGVDMGVSDESEIFISERAVAGRSSDPRNPPDGDRNGELVLQCFLPVSPGGGDDAPDYVSWHRILRDVHWCLGDKARAAAAYRRFVAMAPEYRDELSDQLEVSE